jgi:hypothetical protein
VRFHTVSVIRDRAIQLPLATDAPQQKASLFVNAASVHTAETVRVRKAAALAHQPAGCSELALRMDGGHRVANRECRELKG